MINEHPSEGIQVKRLPGNTTEIPIQYHLKRGADHDTWYAQYFVQYLTRAPHVPETAPYITEWAWFRHHIDETAHAELVRPYEWRIPQTPYENMTADVTALHKTLNEHVRTYDAEYAEYERITGSISDLIVELYYIERDGLQPALDDITGLYNIINVLSNNTYGQHVNVTTGWESALPWKGGLLCTDEPQASDEPES